MSRDRRPERFPFNRQGNTGGGGTPSFDVTPSLLLEADATGMDFILLENGGQIYLETA